MTRSTVGVVGVEIGGTKLQCALGTATGEVLSRERERVEPGWTAREIYDWVEQAINRAIAAAASVTTSVQAVGVGFGGPVDTATGTVLVSHQVSGWENRPLKLMLEKRFGLPVVVENDANAAGWAEYCLGAGRGTRNFMYTNIGSGIGGALVIGGVLYNGQGLGAAEIGHTWVPDWTVSTPGQSRKLELLCSGWSIEKRIRAWTDLDRSSLLWELCGGNPSSLTAPMLAEAARRGDARALGEIASVAETVGLALANAATLLHPEIIALGGGVSLMGEVLLQPLRKSFENHLFGPFRGTTRVVPCQLEEDVVIVGALLLAGALVSS